MPVPSYRVPVVVARGTIAALTAGLASLQEGEICYATDEDTLYVVEGGVLTEATGTGSGSLQDVVDDTSPQLGGDLDVNGFEFISTAAGNIVFTPDTTGVVEIKGNTGNDAAIQLNCEANTHGIKLKSPPHSAAASYTLVFPGDTGTTGQALTTDGSGGLSWATPSTVGSIDDLSDVDTTTVAPTDGQALLWDNTAGQWEPGTTSTVGSIDDLTDVDTTTAAPTDGQALVWDNANSEWVPGNVATDIGTTSIDALSDVDTTTVAPTNDQVLAWDGTNWVPADAATGGGGSTSTSLTESQTAASGIATFSGIGHSGTLVDITSSLDAWIVLYDSAASRTADNSRAYTTDPTAGSGVLAEFYITASGTVLATPGTTYFNNDTSVTEAVYAAVRDQAGADVNSVVTITAYGNQTITSVSGGTFGSGV